MARNRKRRSDRRQSRPSTDERSRVATARPGSGPGDDEAPSPIEHAAPDVELAEAQLAAGRAEADAFEDDSLDADHVEDGPALAERSFRAEEDVADGRSDGERGAGASLTREPRSLPGGRLVGFARGSWRELQRVQWPDRRQVAQATGVVIGFVIVAGAFLGGADWVAGKIVHFLLS